MSRRKRVSSEVISGVYCIQNIITRKRYIGSSKDIYDRWVSHIRELNKNQHHCSHLQNSWNEYGENNFIFFIVERCPQEERFAYEQFWHDYYNVYDDHYGYNVCKSSVIKNESFTIDDIINGKSIMDITQFNTIIDYLVNTDISIPKISQKTNVPKSTIYSIYFREEYATLTKDLQFVKRSNKTMAKLNEEKVKEIISLLVDGVYPSDIARKYGINPNMVYDIRNRNTWREYTDGVEFPDISGVHQPSKQRKSVIQYDINGFFIQKHLSVMEAGECTGVLFKDISACCLGKVKSAGGYIWRFDGDDLNKFPLPQRILGPKAVDQYSKDNVFIKTFKTIREAQQETGAKTIGSVLSGKNQTSGGFRWVEHGKKLA